MKKLVNKNSLFIIIISALIILPIFFLRDFTPKNELKYINIAVNMVNSHNFFSMYDNIEVYTDKPPFFFWLINIISNIFKGYNLGIIGFFLSYIPALTILFISFFFSKRYIGKNASLFAPIALITTPIFFITASCIRMDMLMTLFIVLSLVIFFLIYDNKLKNTFFNSFLIYLFIGAAVYIKGAAGIVVPIFTIIIFLLLEKNLSFLKKIYFIQGIFVILTMFLLWFIPSIYFNGSGYLSDIFKKQLLGRAVNSTIHKRAFYYYVSILPLLYFQWFPFIVSAFIFFYKKRNSIKLFEKFMFIWALFTILFFSLVSSKLWIYLLPAVFPMAIILTSFIRENIENNSNYIKIPLFITSTLNILLGTAVLILHNNLISSISINDFIFSAFIFIVLSTATILLYSKNKVLSIYLPTAVTFIFLTINLAFVVPKYNNIIGLKDGISKLKSISSDIVAYKFTPGVYGGVYINKNIKVLISLSDISVSQNTPVAIITRTKYANEINEKEFTYNYIYKNSEFSIISIINKK